MFENVAIEGMFGIGRNKEYSLCGECGVNGETKVVHINQEWNYAITVIAENFEDFVCKLCSATVFEKSENDKAVDLGVIEEEMVLSEELLIALNTIKKR